MKHKIFKTLLAAVAATMTFCAEAATETVNGIEWTYTVKNGEVILGGWNSPRSIPESTSGAITIPSTLGGYPVTSFGYRAFCGRSSLTSVTIPNSVTSIGSAAFFGCKGLADSNGFIIIRGVLHGYCGEGGAVLIPDSVTNIGDWAFCGCESLTSVTIPNSVTSIGEYAFCDCSSLTGVTIPNSVTNIRGGAFKGCSSLTSVTIPNSVMNIGVGAFGRCGELTIYTDKGNSDRLRKMLENTGANVKEIIEQKAKEQEAEEQESRGIRWWFVLGCVGVIVGLFFWIVLRKKKKEGASDKTGNN